MKFRLITLAAMLGAGCPALLAQNAPLTLERAIDLALTRNERALQAEARVDAAQARLSRARTFFFPDLTLNGTYTRRAYETVREIGGEQVTIQSFDAFNGSANLSQTLFDARAFPLLRQARYSFQSIQFSSADEKLSLAYEAADAYIITLSREQVHAAAERRLQFAEASLQDSQARFEAGLVSSNDVTRARLELATAAREASRTRGEVDVAYLALGNLLNAEVTGPLAPPEELLATAAAVQVDPAAAIAHARAERPDILALERNALALREFAEEPRRRVIPTLTFNAQARATNEGGLSGRDQDANASVLFGWPLFDGGSRYAERAERLALLREARLDTDALHRDIELEIRSAVVVLGSERASLEAATIATQAARQNFEETTELYRQGLTGALEVADATTQLFTAEVEEARARYELARALLVFRAASGRQPLSKENQS